MAESVQAPVTKVCLFPNDCSFPKCPCPPEDSVMKTCYVINEFKVTADLVRPGELTSCWTITRINVPEEYRGLGLGTDILNRVLHDADRGRITLMLEPQPSGPLNYNELVAWYERYEFRMTSLGYMKRLPSPVGPLKLCSER